MAEPFLRARRALIVAGEASGDHLAGKLVASARELDPALAWYGVGGGELAGAGGEVLVPYRELAVTGLVEVIRHYPEIRRVFNRLAAELTGPRRPDLLVLVDYPDFNMRLAEKARKAGVPVLYYVSPQVWAWRRGRVRTMARVADRLAVIFPFEPALYAGTGLRVEFVGHPLVEDAAAAQDRGSFRAALGLDAETPVVGLFPGSRRSEIAHSYHAILGAAQVIHRGRPDTRFLIPLAPVLDPALVEGPLAGRGLPVTVLRSRLYDVANACDAVVAVSGTATLQTALIGTPMAILYRMAPLSAALLRPFVSVPHIGMPNIVAGERVVAEFVQERATPEAIGGEILRILGDTPYRETIRRKLAMVREKLGAPGASRKVARMAVEMSGGKPGS